MAADSDKYAEKLNAALKKRIAELTRGQYKRADAIETALARFEKNIRIRSVTDYISLSGHQRRLLGIPDKLEVAVELPDEKPQIDEAERKVAERLKKIKGKK